MKVLVIWIWGLGDFVIHSFLELGCEIELYTRNQSKYKRYNRLWCIWLSSLADTTQPDVIFITANQYTPEDRYEYMQRVYSTEGFIDVRDHEVIKNGPMIENIWEQLKHLCKVPIIITANPNIFLIGILRNVLGRDSIYGMMSMLDNKRVADLLWVNQEKVVSIWEHGNSVGIFSHIIHSTETLYDKVNEMHSSIREMVYIWKGIPNYEAPFVQLRKIIQAIWGWKELWCILEAYQEDIWLVTWMPYTVQWTDFVRENLPRLSEYEKQQRYKDLVRIKNKYNKYFW